MRTPWGQRLAQRWLASAPALWGKLPSHGDYVRYRATAAQAHAWGEWVELHWHAHAPAQAASSATGMSRRQRRDGPSPWISTQAQAPTPRLQDVPVAFVLPPNTMPFAKRQFVQGAWVPSQDRSGRACPLILFQTVSPQWLQHTTLADTTRERHAGHPQHWLYWLARLAAHVQGGANDFNTICHALDALWSLHAPSWSSLWGHWPGRASTREHDSALGALASVATHDPMQGLRGVAQLPWPHWPQTLLDDTPQAAYWQQDARGGYVNAALNLEQLWKAHT